MSITANRSCLFLDPCLSMYKLSFLCLYSTRFVSLYPDVFVHSFVIWVICSVNWLWYSCYMSITSSGSCSYLDCPYRTVNCSWSVLVRQVTLTSGTRWWSLRMHETRVLWNTEVWFVCVSFSRGTVSLRTAVITMLQWDPPGYPSMKYKWIGSYIDYPLCRIGR